MSTLRATQASKLRSAERRFVNASCQEVEALEAYQKARNDYAKINP